MTGMLNLAQRPPLASGERLGGGRVKGSMIRAHLDWVCDFASREGTIELFAAMPADVRQQVSTVLASAWYDFETLIAVDRTILAVFGGQDIGFLEQLGAYSARRNLSGVYRSFRRDGVHDFFRHAATLHSQFQDFGTAQYAVVTAGAGTMRHAGYPCFSPLYCASALGFYRECVVLHGGNDIDVIETGCQCEGAAACVFSIRWR
jgi:hypothetical protein